MARRWTRSSPGPGHTAEPRARDPQAGAARALAVMVVGAVLIVLVWGWIR